MAYIDQETKKKLAPEIKKVLKKYGMKGTISIKNHMALCVTLRQGALDLIGNINRYNKELCDQTGEPFFEVKDYYQANAINYRGTGNETIDSFFRELISAMKGDIWFDNSDSMTDYFHTAYYLDIDVGKYNRPYIYTG